MLILALLALQVFCARPSVSHARQSTFTTRTAVDPPLPPRRPRNPSDPKLAPRDAEKAVSDEQVEAGACVRLLRELGVSFAPAPPNANAGACAIADPVLFQSVQTLDGKVIALDAAVTVRCTLAAQLASWIREDLDAIVRKHGLHLRRLVGAGGQECRSRNRVNGERLSEHASGNAFDVHKLEIEDARTIKIMGRDDAFTELRRNIKTAACARFSTVLGSGSDGFHEDHLHVDQRERRGGRRLCQWQIDVPSERHTPD